MDAKRPEKNGRWKQWKRYVLAGSVLGTLLVCYLLGVATGMPGHRA